MLSEGPAKAGLLDKEELFSPVENKKKIALAVSGGADSLALMVLAAQWKKSTADAPEVLVYSVDHGLRDEAKSEVEFVLRSAGEFGFEARGLTLNTRGAPVSQAEARRVRYRIIGEAMVQDGAQTLLTGHHLQDQGETILMRLAHGSGISGLCGMRRFAIVGGVEIFRPLLKVSQEDLVRIVKDACLRPVTDPSNFDEKYERVRWRKAMPVFLELGLDAPGLSRFGARMARANAALEHLTRSTFGEVVSSDEFGVFSISHADLLRQSQEIAIRLVSLMLDYASGKRGPAELAQVETLCSALRGGQIGGQTLAGCIVEIYNNSVFVFRECARIEGQRTSVKPGEKVVWDRRFVIENKGETEIFLSFAKGMTRAEAERLSGRKIHRPMSAVCGAPLVADTKGAVLALGERVFAPCVSVRHISETKLLHKAGKIE